MTPRRGYPCNITYPNLKLRVHFGRYILGKEHSLNTMATFAQVRSAFNPSVPQDFKELGISETLVLDLVLRRMLIEGYSSIAGLGRSLRISHRVVDLVFKHMRTQSLVEIKGMLGNDYSFTLSAAGKQLAGER